MTNHPDKHNRAPQSRLRFTYVILALSLGLFVVALLYSAWAKNREHDANMPVPAPEAVVVALRTFHRQTGRFPKDFRELDERLWKGTRQAQISADGTSLVAPSSHYYYTLHTINPAQGERAAERVKAALWAVPTGIRSSEAATYFLYVTPDKIERWMGSALTQENVGVACTIPSEQQLALLVMTKQAAATTVTNQSSKGIFSIFGF